MKDRKAKKDRKSLVRQIRNEADPIDRLAFGMGAGRDPTVPRLSGGEFSRPVIVDESGYYHLLLFAVIAWMGHRLALVRSRGDLSRQFSPRATGRQTS